jgi:hypothetical protein
MRNIGRRYFIDAICILTFSISLVSAGVSDPVRNADSNKEPVAISRATSSIRIDGVIDEKAWRDACVVDVTTEVQPGENVPAPVKAKCFITYDDTNLYFAFWCQDTDPSAIQAHYTDRDGPGADDLIGVFLDTFNDERHAFVFACNPLGVQIDGIREDAGGQGEDYSWDAIWDSAGRITDEGYEVEIAIPFNQIRFSRGGEEQTWGIMCIRVHPRSQRRQIGNFSLDRNKNCFLCQAPKFEGFEGVKPGRNLEFSPTVTALRTDERSDFPDGEMVEKDSQAAVGLSARWGITPNIVFNGALNPDFSNVEADIAQLDINTQFALYYPEKRPFFLEGQELFLTPYSVVYTRAIADPLWGTKITGKEGKNSLGLYVARDEITNLLFPGSESSSSTSLATETTSSVFRYRRDVGGNSTIGLLLTDREAEDYYNRLFGVDGHYRFTETDSISYQLIGSSTRYPDHIARGFGRPDEGFSGHAAYVGYTHSTRNWGGRLSYYDVGEGFRADLGFMPQVDYRQGHTTLWRTLYGDEEDWYTRMEFEVDFGQEETQDGNLLSREFEASWSFESALQSFFFAQISRNRNAYLGEQFVLNRQYLSFNARPVGSLQLGISGYFGDWIYYTHVQPAKRLRVGPWFVYTFGRNLTVDFSHSLYRLTVDGGRLFLANLSELRLVYQFNIRTFIRAIFQYRDTRYDPDLYAEAIEAKQRLLFTQFLFSYKINPRTVLFLGYSDNYYGENGLSLTQTDRTFFVKLGYAWVL